MCNTDAQIDAFFKAVASKSVTMPTAQSTSLILAFRALDLFVYRCRLHGTKLHPSFSPNITFILKLMTENTLSGLTTFISNCTGRMDMIGYGDNLMHTLILHVNRGLVEPLL
ncbi:hypothetical protein NPIL_118481 [Nephila pilipes]|uniref:Uncharacterized protein n=1 Tax=Nephila pilipes TaxID=299642 RepID=A0A8X6QFX0_NEPPI|nr:hypothetical protein NPIL_118481 [Nephila pilipes]